MQMIKLICFILLFTNVLLRCYGDDLVNQVEENKTEGEIILDGDGDDDAWKNTNNRSNEKVTGDGMNKTRKKMEGKIVGGKYTSIKEFPHAVFLLIMIKNKSSSFCGSSVLNQRLLLTAAHCVYDCKTNKFDMDAVAGNTDITRSTVIRKVKKYMIHVDYEDDMIYTDIALLQLKRNLPLSNTIQRVIIRPTFPEDTEATVVGWGIISEEGATTIILKKVQQKLQNISECNKFISEKHGIFCATSGSVDDYPYSGDSGSALITKTFQEIGLVSHLMNDMKEVIVYTNVSYFYEWIVEKSMVLICAEAIPEPDPTTWI